MVPETFDGALPSNRLARLDDAVPRIGKFLPTAAQEWTVANIHNQDGALTHVINGESHIFADQTSVNLLCGGMTLYKNSHKYQREKNGKYLHDWFLNFGQS